VYTIQEAIEACKDVMKSVIGSGHTRRAYFKGLDIFSGYLLSEFGLKPDHPITEVDIEKFIQYPVWIKQNSPTRKTALVRGSAAKWFLDKWLIQNRLIDPSYADGKRLATAMQIITQKSAKLPMRVPGEGDVERAIAAARVMTDKEPLRSLRIAVASFLAASGLRAQELANLKCGELNMVRRDVFVRSGKEDKDRLVPFSVEAAQDVQDYWAARGWSLRDDPAFANHSRRVRPGEKKQLTTNQVRGIVDTLRTMAGIEGELTPHYFRHYFANRVLRKTGNIKLVAELLGHSDISVTEIYIHMNTDDLHVGYDKAFGDSNAPV
jgi:site-specific recombinase XerD